MRVRLPRVLASAIALSLCACGPTAVDDGGDDDSVIPPSGTPPAKAKVYAHSDAELFEIDPDDLDVRSVGSFAWPDDGYDSMTDIAINKAGTMVGISFDKVYVVNPATAKTTLLADLDRSFNGMSFVPAQEIDGTGAEVLVAAALDGSFYRLDPTTGNSTPIGNYGSDMGSSGDVVSVSGFGTIATVTRPDSETDWLVRVDAATGRATPIGDTGVTGIWGLGFWENKVYGFTDANAFVLIDVQTGRAMAVEEGSVSWWGAGVTTSAPVIP